MSSPTWIYVQQGGALNWAAFHGVKFSLAPKGESLGGFVHYVFFPGGYSLVEWECFSI